MAEDINAETKASLDLTEANQDGQIAHFAFICHLRDFDWVSAVNSMVLERAAHDAEALRQAGDTQDDIRTEWEMIARGMTVDWNPAEIDCNKVEAAASNLDPLAAKGGYNKSP